MYVLPDAPAELGFDGDKYPMFRPFQRQAIEQLLNSEKRLIVVSAPTGAGKSVIALAAARMVAEAGYKTTILTHRLSLQKQYMDYEFDRFQPKEATGRKNWKCILEGQEHITVDEAICTDGFKCELSKWIEGVPPVCPYFYQREIANAAAIRVLNYPYFILQANYNGKFTPNELLICDEGHQVDKEILKASCVEFGRGHLFQLKLRGTPFPRFMSDSFLSENPHIFPWALNVEHELDAEINTLVRREEKVPKTLANLHAAVKKISTLKDKMVVLTNTGGEFVKFSPVLPEEYADKMIMRHAKKVVLMSASIFGPDYWADRMGIPRDEVEFIEVPSVFPAENRKILVLPVVAMNWKTWGDAEAMAKMMRAVDWAIKRNLPTKGVIHSVSFRLANYIYDHSDFRKLMIVGGADKLEEFLSARLGIYVSPSALEGLDLKDELARYIIFPKVPYLDLGDPVIRAQKDAIADFYVYEAQSAVLQGAGRGVRHENDYAVTYILDKNYARLYHATKHMLPEWFKEALDWRKLEL